MLKATGDSGKASIVSCSSAREKERWLADLAMAALKVTGDGVAGGGPGFSSRVKVEDRQAGTMEAEVGYPNPKPELNPNQPNKP